MSPSSSSTRSSRASVMFAMHGPSSPAILKQEEFSHASCGHARSDLPRVLKSHQPRRPHRAGPHSLQPRPRVTLVLLDDGLLSASSNRNMRRTLSSFVAVLCLLTLFVSSAACLSVGLPQNTSARLGIHHDHLVGASDHACCPQRSPAGEHTSSTCCTVHHQPVSAVSAVELEQPDLISDSLLSTPILNAAAIYPPAKRKIGIPPQPPPIALRI